MSVLHTACLQLAVNPSSSSDLSSITHAKQSHCRAKSVSQAAQIATV